MIVLAIDPGPSESAFVYYDTKTRELLQFAKFENDRLIEHIIGSHNPAHHLAVEMIASYGMAVGREVFDTCVWIGRFVQAWEQNNPSGWDHTFVYRREVKLQLCGSARAKDANVRQALIDRYGGSRKKAIGTKAAPRALYGVSNDVWQALGVAVTYGDTRHDR